MLFILQRFFHRLDVALNKLTSHDLMLIMQAFEKAYYDGKNSPKD